MRQIILIAAISENNVIGKDNALPWKLKDDMRLFKNLTTSHTVIMGRKSFESMGSKPLPNRQNIVVSRNEHYNSPGCICTSNLAAAMAISSSQSIFIIGGAQIYELALPHCTHFFRTTVHASIEGNVKFPQYDKSKWKSQYFAKYKKGEVNDHDFTFELLKSKC